MKIKTARLLFEQSGTFKKEFLKLGINAEDYDIFKKPTQYWFLNCKPEQNVLFEAIPVNEVNISNAVSRSNKEIYSQVAGVNDRKTMRSMIHPDYANRFIRTYLIKEET